MVHFIELALVIVILVVVGIPLFGKAGRGNVFAASDPDLERYKHLLVRKEEILLGIKELEFDFKTEKLSPEDFENTRNKLQAEALATLEEIDRLEKEHSTKPGKSSRKMEMA